MIVDDILRRHCLLRPDHTAIEYEGRTISYRELNGRACRIANALAGLGVTKGQRVGILSRNCSEYVETYFGNAKAGAVTVPLNYRLTASELEYIINDSEAVCLIVSSEYIDVINEIRDKLTSVKHFICLGGNADGYSDFESWASGASEARLDVDVDENDLVYQMYTSGTTGRPKGAMLTHRNVLTNVVQILLLLPSSPDTKALIVAPLYHAAAGITTFCHLAAGATLMVKTDFIPDEVLASFEKDRITHALLVPAMILFLLGMPGVEKVDFSRLQYIVYGASAIPAEVLRKAISVFGCKFFQAFGQTESTAVLTALMPEDHVPDGTPEQQKLLSSCGREVFGCEVRVVDEDGNECAPGEMGEIVARGAQVMRGYWNMPEATEKTLAGGWLHTGDLGTKDEHGYVFIMDRLKDMIVSGGENVYPREIEEVLFTHPAIADAAVIGIPSDKWGEEVKAIVVLKPDATAGADEIKTYCDEKLAGYKRPRSIDFVDALPKNPSGKILKRELREPYWKDVGRRVN